MRVYMESILFSLNKIEFYLRKALLGEWITYEGGWILMKGLKHLGIINYGVEGPIPTKVKEMLWTPLTLIITFIT